MVLIAFLRFACIEMQEINVFHLIVAPEAILEAAGGTLTDVNGVHYKYGENESFPNRMGVFATAKHIDHQKLIAKLPVEIKQSLSEA